MKDSQLPQLHAQKISLNFDHPRGRYGRRRKGYRKRPLTAIYGHELSCALKIAQYLLGDQVSSKLNQYY